MKLKRLIANGFKSFADRTEFDFDSGISCIVGPNGCGKSNVVDAIKWVLGEQSAKSLRGSEMLDVIFNGSSSRGPGGRAEVTLVFDNSDGILPPPPGGEAPTDGIVSITRRLFRSGQSEYLINKNVCRLKDIREMFMDTGMGRDAYGVIEQGRVEAFLQAGQEERRAIFDEAAGISKYKARKKEALRKLERVEQNMLRLNDIIAEVEKRLRSIKVQAGRARSYQVHTERLKELRSLHYLAQYHELSGKRGDIQKALDAQSDTLSSISTQIGRLESAASATEIEAVDVERTSRELQARLAAVGGQITATQERAEMLTTRVKELAEQIVTASGRCEQMEAKIAACQEEVNRRQAEMESNTARTAELNRQYESLREEHAAAELELSRLQANLEDEKAGTIDLLRRTAQLHNEISGLGIRKENLHGQQERLNNRAEEITTALKDILTERAKFETGLADVKETLAAAQTKLDETRLADEQAHAGEEELHGKISAAREHRSALSSRADTLREMQARLEGVATGVRRALQAKTDGKLECICGMLGDFINTDRMHANVVAAALAGAEQLLLARHVGDVSAAAGELNEIVGDNGSVEIACLDNLAPYADDFNTANLPEAAARAIDWVQYESWLAPLMWRLLGKTLVVDTLLDAARAAQSSPKGYRFVTRGGQVLEADGTVRIGAANRGAGVIERRSELSELESQLAELDDQIDDLAQQSRQMRDRREHLAELQQQLRTAVYEANTERLECQNKLTQLNDSIEQLEREKPLVTGDLENLEREIATAVQREHDAREKAEQLEQLNKERQAEVDRLTQQIVTGRAGQERRSARMTEHKVALAEAQQKTVACRDALTSLQRQREQMESDLNAEKAEIERRKQQRSEAEAAIAAANEEVERLYKEHESLQMEVNDAEETRQGLNEKLQDIRKQLSEQRSRHDELAEAVSGRRVELGELDTRVEGLITRAAEEMNMDLVTLAKDYEHDTERDWEAVRAEIQELRQKIERLGNVNLDAIGEQDELEERQKFLAEQLADINASQHQLRELIRKINRESRQRFQETFDAVRANFQELFRKLFGGGRADIMLVDGEDILESPIEIVARPPGKELRNLSLLSGGEKTMTALAMLFSIFKSRPSPFCLLDEVDAALDEANNQRFNLLLEEFVEASQFIVITHSKRTMAIADVLYGVTMQEPGVSRRISVRFEDADQHIEQGEAVTA